MRDAVKGSTPSAKDQIKHVLDETLILITGLEILIGFQYNSVFTRSFGRLPQSVQYVQVVGLVLLLLTLILIMAPVPYHRITERGYHTARYYRFVRRMVLIGLSPFALGIGMDVYVVTQKVAGQAPGLIAGILASCTAFLFWYVIEFNRRRVDGRASMKHIEAQLTVETAEKSTLSDRVDHVLSEARTVLPGAQALLGFQFISIFADGFDSLSDLSKYFHLISLALITLSSILLMTPAAYHRIVEQGEDTEHFQRLASRCVLFAMVFLALGIALNFYIVVAKVTTSESLAVISALIILTLFYSFWFGYTFYKRQQLRTPKLLIPTSARTSTKHH